MPFAHVLVEELDEDGFVAFAFDVQTNFEIVNGEHGHGVPGADKIAGMRPS